MKHLFNAARSAAAARVAAAGAQPYGSINPDDLKAAIAHRDAIEAEIALVQKAVASLRGIVSDVEAVRLDSDSNDLNADYLDPAFCLELSTYEFMGEGVVVEWPNLVIEADAAREILACHDALMAEPAKVPDHA